MVLLFWFLSYDSWSKSPNLVGPHVKDHKFDKMVPNYDSNNWNSTIIIIDTVSGGRKLPTFCLSPLLGICDLFDKVCMQNI